MSGQYPGADTLLRDRSVSGEALNYPRERESEERSRRVAGTETADNPKIRGVNNS